MWCQGRWWVGSYIFFSPLDSHLPPNPCARTQWICPQASSVSSWMPSFFKTFLFCHLFLQLVLPPPSSSRAPTCGAAHLQRKERVECWTSPPLLKNTSTQFDDQTSALQLQQKSFEFRMTTQPNPTQRNAVFRQTFWESVENNLVACTQCIAQFVELAKKVFSRKCETEVWAPI